MTHHELNATNCSQVLDGSRRGGERKSMRTSRETAPVPSPALSPFDELLTQKQVGKILNASEDHVEKLRNQGHLDYVRIGCGPQRPAIRIFASSVRDFIERRTIKP